MYISSISLSYLFFAICAITFIVFLYFKFLVMNTSDKSSKRTKIIGNMKNPDKWRKDNNKMAFISLFWSIISLGVFVYLKFFFGIKLVSIIYPFAYLAMVVAILLFFIMRRKTTT